LTLKMGMAREQKGKMILLVIILALILMILGAPIFIVISGLALYCCLPADRFLCHDHRNASDGYHPHPVAIPLFAFADISFRRANSSEAHPAFRRPF